MTPEYAAPEQHHGHQANERTDLYSIGLLLLQLLYGFPPRVRHADAVPQIQELMATSSSRGEPLPEALGGILYQALALDPLQRQVSVQYLQHQLENLLDLDGAPKLQRGMNSVPYTILSPDPVTVTAQGCPTKPIYHLRRNRLRAQRLTRLQRLAREWERQGRLPDYLLRGQPLAQMTKLVAWQDNQTRAEVRLYLEAGHMAEAEAKTREEQQRAEGALTQKTLFRLKWLCLGLGALLIATLIWHFNCK